MKSKKDLRVTLVGAGGYGRSHLMALRQMNKEGLARLTDIVDPFPERLPEEYLALAGKDVRWHRSWEDFIEAAPSPDAVMVAAPIHLHLDYARKAYATGAYVYLEKPPVPLLGQMESLMAMEHGAPRIQIGFAFPLSTQMRVLKLWLAEGKLGRIISYRLTGCYPRGDVYYKRASWAGKLWEGASPAFDGPATNALAHRVHDLLHIEALACGEVVQPEQLCSELYRARPIQSYDTCSARGVFPSGATFALSLSHATSVQSEFVLEITGEKGKAAIGGQELALTADFSPERVLENDEMIFIAFRDFLKTVRERGRPSIGLPETRPYVVTTNSMLASSNGIHSIDEKFLRKVRTRRGEIYDVDKMNELSLKAFHLGRNFSEVGAPWGVPGQVVHLGEVSAMVADQNFAALSLGGKRIPYD